MEYSGVRRFLSFDKERILYRCYGATAVSILKNHDV